MGKLALILGGSMGAAMPAFANIIARQWMLRRPWFHVAFGIAGAYIFNVTDNYVETSNEARKADIKLVNEVFRESDQVKALRRERIAQADAVIQRDGIDLAGNKSGHH